VYFERVLVLFNSKFKMKGTKEQKKKKDIVHGNVLCVRIKPFTMTIKHVQKKVFLEQKLV
jgi:hypothetical protein